MKQYFKTAFLVACSALLVMSVSMDGMTHVYAAPLRADDPVMKDTEFASAVQWMAAHGLTKFTEVAAFAPYDIVTREQAAKFYSQFAINVLFRVIDMKKYCEFDDLSKADKSLQNAILESCMLSLFRGNDGKFAPKQTLTKAEAVVVLLRALYGWLDESGQIRWKAYYDEARHQGIIKDKTTLEDMEKSITRYELGLLLFRASVVTPK